MHVVFISVFALIFSELMFQFGETGKRIWNWNIPNALECWFEWHCFKFAKKKMLNVRVQCSWFGLLISYTCTRHLCKTAQRYAEWRSFRRWKWNRSCKKAWQAVECLVVYSGYYVVCYGNLAITPEIHGSRKILHRSTIFSLLYTQELISFNF